MLFFPYDDDGDSRSWDDAIRLSKTFAIFVTILVILWGLGAVILAVQNPVHRQGMENN